MVKVIDAQLSGAEAADRAHHLMRRAADMPAYFERPGSSNGPTEAIDCWLALLRGSALGFCNLTTASPDAYWKPAGSGADYTLNSEEPLSSLRDPIIKIRASSEG